MKNTNPKKIALNITLLITGVFIIIYLALSIVFGVFKILPFIILPIVLFFIIYFTVKYVIETFIYEKIRIIYKTIHNIKGTKQYIKEEHSNDKNLLENVNQEVLDWVKDRRQEIEELKKLEIYRREYIGNVSHELKTPIFNIQGYILTLLDGGLEDETINKEYLLRTEKSINRMIAIVQDLEAISQLESGELKLEFSKFDIITLVKEVVEFVEIKAKKRKVKLIIDSGSDKYIMVYADKKRIRQVLTNLIENSIKYAGDKDSTSKISFFDMDEMVLIEVSDNGIGVSESDIPRLFERFYRTDKGRSRGQGGTGLGLSIVKHIIEAHNQTINVRSALGVGTTFGFTLKKGE